MTNMKIKQVWNGIFEAVEIAAIMIGVFKAIGEIIGKFKKN